MKTINFFTTICLVICFNFFTTTATAQHKNVAQTVYPNYRSLSFKKLCPNRADGSAVSHKHGWDFGEAVNTSTTVYLYVSPNKKQVIADIVIDMKNVSYPYKKNVKLTARWKKVIYNAPYKKSITGFKIAGETYINRFAYTSVNKILPGGGAEFIGCNDGTIYSVDNIDRRFIERLRIIGDTGANDISADPDCSCDSRIEELKIKSFPIYIYDSQY